PLNNVVRVALQALSAVLGGTQSLHTNAYDEALALPTQSSATLALRTQQVLAHETGVPEVADPVGGSYYVESLTDAIERQAQTLVGEIESRGGAARSIEQGYFQEAIARSAYEQQRRVEAEEQVVVGVNRFADDRPLSAVPAPDYRALAEMQRRRLAEARRRRDAGQVEAALAGLRAAAVAPAEALMPRIIEAVRARASVGDISDVLREVWGEYRPR
ncbi:MAG: methylmalonyl-CoA mutase family protein, partial [Gemmatimonadales bacterium]